MVCGRDSEFISWLGPLDFENLNRLQSTISFLNYFCIQARSTGAFGYLHPSTQSTNPLAFREWNAQSRFRLKNCVMHFGAWKTPFTTTLSIYILLDFRGFHHLHIILEKISLLSSWNSANFDMWTVSVDQVAPEFPPPTRQLRFLSRLTLISEMTKKSAKKTAEFRGSAEDFTAWPWTAMVDNWQLRQNWPACF